MKKRTTAFILLITLLFSFCSCTEETIDSVCSSERAYSHYSSEITDDSSSEIESSEEEYSFVSSDISLDDPIELSDFTFTTDKTEYDYKEAIKLTLTIDSESSVSFSEDYYVEYFDGEWKKCEIEYVCREPAYIAIGEATIKFPLSERADKGREKYRVGLEVRTQYGAQKEFTVYSNEFFIKAE